MISEPKELYMFLSSPGIELTSLLFASDHVVWLSWHYAEEKHIPNLRHTNEVTGAYVTMAAGCNCIATWTRSKIRLCTAIQIP